jgi:hypothetical protein
MYLGLHQQLVSLFVPSHHIFFMLVRLKFFKVFMSGSFVIYMVGFLYLADW